MSSSRAIAVAAMLVLSDCRRGPFGPFERDREADGMQERGKQMLDQQRYVDAGKELQTALRRHRSIGDHAAASADASLLARVHRGASEYGDALRMAELAREEAASSGDKALLASALMSLGNTLQAIGDEPRALEIFKEAARHLPESDKLGRARLAFYRGLGLDSRGRRAEAAQRFAEARDLAGEIGEQRMVRDACTNLAAIALSEEKLDDADFHLREARAAWRSQAERRIPRGILINESALARKRGNLSAAQAALDQAADGAPLNTMQEIANERGLVAEAAGRFDEAERQYREAVAAVEQLRQNFAPEDAKAPFLEDRWTPYQSLFALQLARNDPLGAFATLAQVQGRMFLDALAVSAAETQGASGSRIDGAISRIDLLRQIVPPLADSRLGEPGSPEKTLAALRGRHILAYFPAGGRLRLVTVVDGEPRSAGVDVDLERLDQLIDAFRSRADDDRAAESLGSALVPPEALPAPPARLTVIPTGPLMRISFAALRVSGRRLLDRYEIAYAPSMTGLAAIAGKRDDSQGPGVVMADTRSDLRYAAGELKIVVERTGATPRTGKDATVSALREAADVPLLHIVSHSTVGPDGGHLFLADGEVTAADIVSWRIRPRLVVLPTCASAATVRSEMWDSLAAAFLAAGSRHVVATLSSVEDDVAAEFTGLFYRHGGARDPIAAVTLAQREMADRVPVGAWSAFVVAGP